MGELGLGVGEAGPGSPRPRVMEGRMPPRPRPTPPPPPREGSGRPNKPGEGEVDSASGVCVGGGEEGFGELLAVEETKLELELADEEVGERPRPSGSPANGKNDGHERC